MMSNLLLLFLIALVSCEKLQHTSRSCVADTDKDSFGVKVFETKVDPQPRVIWVGGNHSEIVFVLSEETNALYRSDDNGKTYTDLSRTGVLRPTFEESRVSNIYSVRANDQHFYAISYDRKSIWTTDNAGETFNWKGGIHTAIDAEVSYLTAHPTHTHVAALVATTKVCVNCEQRDPNDYRVHQNVYLTVDFGANWQLVRENVAFSIGFVQTSKENAHGLLFSQNDPGRISLVCDFNCVTSIAHFNEKTGVIESFESLYNNADSFQEIIWAGTMYDRDNDGDGYFTYALQYNKKANDNTTTTLALSTDGGLSWRDAKLPIFDNEQLAFAVTQATKDATIVVARPRRRVGVDDNLRTATLFVSKQATSNEFVEILPYVTARFSYSLFGYADVEPAQGLEGILIANSYDVEGTEAAPRRGSCLRTRITYNYGGQWNTIDAPASQCPTDWDFDTNGPCKLQFTSGGESSLYYPVYSVPGALGIWFARGFVGECAGEMPAEGDKLWFSRDAGHTWRPVAAGHYTYEIAAHGGLLTIVERAQPDRNTSTTQLQYSLDEGFQWHECKAFNVPVLVENIVTRTVGVHGDFGQHSFILYGRQANHGVLLYVDFTDTWSRRCSGHTMPNTAQSDYEIWSPHKNNCTLGHYVQYIRRKADAQCDNTFERETILADQRCPCTDEDYFCNYCYEPNPNGHCQLINSFECEQYYNVPKLCAADPSATSVTIPNKYVLEPNNECDPNAENSVNYKPSVEQCQGRTDPPATSRDERCPTLSCSDCVSDLECQWCAPEDIYEQVQWVQGACSPIKDDTVGVQCATNMTAARMPGQCDIGVLPSPTDGRWPCSNGVSQACDQQCASPADVLDCYCDFAVARCARGCNSYAMGHCEQLCQDYNGVARCDCDTYNQGGKLEDGVKVTCNIARPDELKGRMSGGSVFALVFCLCLLLFILVAIGAFILHKRRSNYNVA